MMQEKSLRKSLTHFALKISYKGFVMYLAAIIMISILPNQGLRVTVFGDTNPANMEDCSVKLTQMRNYLVVSGMATSIVSQACKTREEWEEFVGRDMWESADKRKGQPV